MLDIVHQCGILRTHNIDLMDLEIGATKSKTYADSNYHEQGKHSQYASPETPASCFLPATTYRNMCRKSLSRQWTKVPYLSFICWHSRLSKSALHKSGSSLLFHVRVTLIRLPISPAHWLRDFLWHPDNPLVSIHIALNGLFVLHD